MPKRTRDQFCEKMQDAQSKVLDAKRILNAEAKTDNFLSDALADDEAELDEIFDRLQKRIDEFQVGRRLEDAEWNTYYRATSPASCGTVCSGCKSHIAGDQGTYGGLCLVCATTPVEERVKVEV